MNKEKFMPIFNTSLLISSLIILLTFIIILPTNTPNKLSVIKENKNTNSVAVISNTINEAINNINVNVNDIDINLQNITIKENETYNITDFIVNVENLPTEITYNYQTEEMSNYQIPNTYKIIIIFTDQLNNTLIKETTLTIEKELTIYKETPIFKEEPKQNTTAVTTNQPTIEEQITNDTKKLGVVGRIYFNSLYSIALYEPTTTEEAQRYVDNEDSGSIYRYGNIKLVADHAYQGFDIIKKQNIGDYIYIKHQDNNGQINIDKYVVNIKTTGYNTRYQILTKDGIDIANDTKNDIALYTCNTSDGKNITILLLSKVN